MKKSVVFVSVILGMTFNFSLLGAETTIQVGTGDFQSHYPLNDYYTYTRSQQLYLASEIGTQGVITKLRWYRSDTGNNPNAIGTTEIWLRPYHYNEFLTSDWEDPGTLVATLSNLDLGSGNQWFEVDIANYEYSGSNLMVSVRTQDAPYESPDASWSCTSVSPLHYSKESHDDYYNPPDYMVYGNLRPNIQLVFEPYTPTAVPNPALALSPADGAMNQLADITLSWNSGGGMPNGYTLYLGTNNPPSNIVNALDLGNSYLYTPSVPFSYGQTYYWQIVPYNAIGSAVNCPVWSFSTLTPVSTFPSIYGFEEEQYPPNGWLHTIVTGASGFQRVNSSTQPTTNPHTGAWMGKYNCRSLPNNSKAKLTSPPIQRTEDGYNYSVSFWMFRDTGFSDYADRINVLVGNRNAQGATLLGTIHRNKSMTPVETGANGWYQYSFILPDGTTDFVTFEAISANGYNISLDDIVFARTLEGGSPPGFAESPTPPNGGNNIPPDVVLSWEPVVNATTYRITFKNAENVVTGVVNTTQTSHSYAAAGYSEQVKWVVDPGNEWGYASELGDPPAWMFTTVAPDVPGAFPPPGSSDWNPGNRLLDWGPLPGAEAYVVKVGTSQGASDVVSGITVSDTKFFNGTDYPQSSNLWWQVNPVRGGQQFQGTWKLFNTGLPAAPVYPVALSENFDSTSPPALPHGWRAMSQTNTCDTGVYTANGSAMSAPNWVYFNDGADPTADQSLVTPVIAPSQRAWTASVQYQTFQVVPSGTGSLTIQCVSDQSSNPTVFSSQAVALSATPAQQTVAINIPANVPSHIAIKPSPGVGICYVDNITVAATPPNAPVNFQIIKENNQLRLRWDAWPSACFNYRVYQANSPNGPWTMVGFITDIYGNDPAIEHNLGDIPAEGEKFYYVTAEYFSPYEPLPPGF